jgi:hypothetical protein
MAGYVLCPRCDQRIPISFECAGQTIECYCGGELILGRANYICTENTTARVHRPRRGFGLLIAAYVLITATSASIGFFTTKPEQRRVVASKPSSTLVDSQGFLIHSLAKRIDQRSSEEIERDLVEAREVSLDGTSGQQVSARLMAVAQQQKRRGEAYLGAVSVTIGRPDLAGLPFHIGLEAVLDREKAQAMNDLSKQLRQAIKSCARAPSGDDSPNTTDLYFTLAGDKQASFKNRYENLWSTAKAVPCINQMLQAENTDVRRMACELLRGLYVPEATESLVKWSVFDTDAGNRAAAVAALLKRDQKEVSRLLLQFIRYPWARAVEHAAEALVALDCQDALPYLIAAYDQPDPDATFDVELPNNSGGTFRQEVVRVKHVKNCMMCHPPSFESTDLVRGAIPDAQRLQTGQSTGYNQGSGSQGEGFIAADVTYLRQDFSVLQPDATPGKKPERLRYDYFVSIRHANPQASKAQTTDSPYRQAIRFAIKELSQHDPSTDSEWMAKQWKTAVKLEDSRVGDVARFVSLQADPSPLTSLKNQVIVRPSLSAIVEKLTNTIQTMPIAGGATPARLALIAYLDPYTRTGEPANRAKAARLLAVALGDTPDADLPTAMRKAAFSLESIFSPIGNSQSVID